MYQQTYVNENRKMRKSVKIMHTSTELAGVVGVTMGTFSPESSVLSMASTGVKRGTVSGAALGSITGVDSTSCSTSHPKTSSVLTGRFTKKSRNSVLICSAQTHQPSKIIIKKNKKK